MDRDADRGFSESMPQSPGAGGDPARRARGVRGAVLLAGIPVVMFGFGFLLVPLYDVFCEVTGLNGKTGIVAPEAAASMVPLDPDRRVRVELLTVVNRSGAWEFRAEEPFLEVTPGKVYSTTFVARNLRDHAVVGQAIPSVAPAQASLHFSKTECFCFIEQRFEAGEEMRMPVRFIVGTRLPERIGTVSLSYTFFDVSARNPT